MLKFSKLYYALILLAVISSCTQKKAAPVVNRNSYIYSRNNYYKQNKHKDNTSATAVSAASAVAASPSRASFVTVGTGDTIYSIATKNNVPLRDLINHNQLKPPYSLKVGEKINLPSAQYYQVSEGDTLYSISRKFQMNVNNLIAMNNLKSPYSVRVGQRIQVSNLTQNNNYNVASKTPTRTQNAASNSTPNATPNTTPAEIKVANKNNRFAWPVIGQVISKFGPKPGGLYNDGINIKAKNGDNVKASEDGVVAYVGNELRGYGNLIIIKHSGGWISAYAHLDKSKVKRGEKVKKGQSIALVGTTGNVKSPQLYFGLRKGREAVNPQMYL